jgi:hypothetical protein
MHAAEVRRTGETPGMRPSEIGRQIKRLFNRELQLRTINGRLWYLKTRNQIGWRENFYYLNDPVGGGAHDGAE